MSLYSYLRGAYHTVLPRRIRTFLWTNRLTRIPREWLLRRAEGLASDQELYDEEYFRTTVDPTGARSAPVMAQSIVSAVHPASVVDVGCGTGQLLMAFASLGVGVRGLEFAEPAIRICQSRGLDVKKFDIEQDAAHDLSADLVVSTEVAEHLPERFADRYVDLLCKIAKVVFITAAVPGTTGTDHVNEQPNEYWIAKFKDRGYDYLEEQSNCWRNEWKAAGVESWYCASAMLFRRVR